jgi:PKD repeat protein
VGNPLTVSLEQPVTFTDLTVNLPTTWQWDFDADGTIDSIVPDPSHQFTVPGFHSVRLSVSNSAGSDEKLETDYVCVTGGAPGEITGLTIDISGTIRWDADARAVSHELVKGDLVLLGQGGGFGGSQLSCLTAGLEAETTDTDEPPPGQGYYYVARGSSCVPEIGTFDTSGPGQAGPRDPDLQGPDAVCGRPP